MTELSEKQAYLAMFAFLEGQYTTTGSSDLGSLLGDLSLLSDGTPGDPAVANEWRAAVAAALAGKVDARLRFTK